MGTRPHTLDLLHEGLKLGTLPVWVPKLLLCIAPHLRAESGGPEKDHRRQQDRCLLVLEDWPEVWGQVTKTRESAFF